MQKSVRWIASLFAFALVTGVSRSAQAQEVETEEDRAPMSLEERVRTQVGFGVSIGGGVFAFTDEATEDFTTTGGNWTARVAIGTRLPLTLETGYIGSANDIAALGLDEDAVLIGNGFEGTLRWNILSMLQDQLDLGFGRISPYVFGGIGWRNYQVMNEDFNTSNVLDDDNVGEIPLGGGIALGFDRFVFDVRGEFRAAWDDELIGGADEDLFEEEDGAGLSQWSVAGRLGWEF